jgi:hypothetical protein
MDINPGIATVHIEVDAAIFSQLLILASAHLFHFETIPPSVRQAQRTLSHPAFAYDEPIFTRPDYDTETNHRNASCRSLHSRIASAPRQRIPDHRERCRLPISSPMTALKCVVFLRGPDNPASFSGERWMPSAADFDVEDLIRCGRIT